MAGYRKKKKNNLFIFIDDFAEGKTDKGEVFFFDRDDFEKIKDYYWFMENGYVVHRMGSPRKRIFMHRMLMDCPSEKFIDHINTNRCDNRKSNLRVVGKRENGMNRGLPKNNTSGVKGVKKHKNGFVAMISEIYLGKYKTFEEAACVRKQAEEIYFKEFSYREPLK